MIHVNNDEELAAAVDQLRETGGKIYMGAGLYHYPAPIPGNIQLVHDDHDD